MSKGLSPHLSKRRPGERLQTTDLYLPDYVGYQEEQYGKVSDDKQKVSNNYAGNECQNK